MHADGRQHADLYETQGEEIANAITHGIGALLGIAGLVLMVIFAAIYGTAWHIVGASIFGASLVVLYLSSTLYHGLTHPGAKYVFEVLDHAAIYILIAGTYTPFTLGPLRGPMGWTMFGIAWGLAILGIVFETLYHGRFRAFTTSLYLAMGWLVVFAIKPLFSAMDAVGIAWLVAGGVSYTAGVIFYYKKWFTFSHTVWHLFVMGGSICHFFAVLKMFV